jgi:hypothetical protein
MLLRDLQCLLEELYGIETGADVRDYLVTCPMTLQALELDGPSRDIEEKLLVEEEGHELGLALYLDADLLERLAALDPRKQLCEANIGDFCTALEGISHFSYLAWNAAIDKPVTLLELEMQAEVDKYIGARLLLGRQGRGSFVGDRLLGRLFDNPVFDDRLDPEELSRYETASHFAGRYCHSLENRFPAGLPGSPMVRELRNFYRWPQPAKVSHIHSTLLS